MLWVPGLAIGFGLAVPLQKRFKGPRLRTAVLTLAAATSVVAILRDLL